MSTSSPTRPLGSALPAFISGSSLAIQAWASASSSTVAPVPIICAITTSSAPPIALIASSRVMRRMALPRVFAMRSPPLLADRTCGFNDQALTRRGEAGRRLGHDPELDCGQDRNQCADDDVDGPRGG